MGTYYLTWRYQDGSCDAGSVNSPKCFTLANENTLLKVENTVGKIKLKQSLVYTSGPVLTAMKLEAKQGLRLGM